MGDVIRLNMVTRLDLPPERVIEAAGEASLDEVVVIGFNKDGGFYFASNKADGGSVLWLLELAKRRLFEAAGE